CDCCEVLRGHNTCSPPAHVAIGQPIVATSAVRGSTIAPASAPMSRPLCAALAVIGIGVPALAHADDRLPMMDPERPVHCARDKEGLVWRIQCDDVAKVCLYAANDELDAAGERRKPLERARECSMSTAFDRDKLE